MLGTVLGTLPVLAWTTFTVTLWVRYPYDHLTDRKLSHYKVDVHKVVHPSNREDENLNPGMLVHRPSSWLPSSPTSKSGACVCTFLITQTNTCTHILTHRSLAVVVSPGLLGVHYFLAWEFKLWVVVLCVEWPWAIRPCFRHSVPLLIERGRKDYLLWVRELWEVPRLLISHLNFFSCLKTKAHFLEEGW